MLWLTLRQLRSDNWEVRRAAVLKLGGTGEGSHLSTLVGCLADPQLEVREAARTALDQLAPAWRDAEETCQAVRAYVAELASADATAATTALAAIGPVAASYLLESFDQLPETAQAAAVDLLGQLEDRRAVNRLLDRFDALPQAVRTKAIRLFGQFRETRAVGRLIEALRYQPSNRPDQYPTGPAGSPYRRCAAFALGKIGDRTALEALVVARTDPEHGVREAAGEALDQMDPDWRSSNAVGRALPIAIARMALDETQDVRAPREARIFVMEQFGERPTRGFAFHDEYRHFLASRALAGHPAAREAVPLLLETLAEDTTGWDQAEAARLLGRIGDDRAVAPLYEAVAGNRPFRSVAAEALLALGAGDRLSPLLTEEEKRILRERAT